MKTILAVIGSLLAGFSAEAQQTQVDSKYGERPASSVFDPSGLLSPAQQQEISEPLVKIRMNEGIDVLVIVLPEIGEAPPKHIARGFAEKWIDTKLHSVVLHVPGHPDSPWISPGEVVGVAIKSEAVEETIAAAERRAAAEPDDFGKIRAASIEAADTIRYWMGGAAIRSEEIISMRLERQLALEKRQRLIKLAAILAMAAAIPMIAGFFFLYISFKNSRPKTFPTLRKTPRLGAPYAGGNHAATGPRNNSTSS